ncbi:MAG: hypothetical protein KDI98_00060, partial [Hyphomicrobiaceae bacterium]|nr:hypothetical protein [Hyphomicrobiaceae bacterium]
MAVPMPGNPLAYPFDRPGGDFVVAEGGIVQSGGMGHVEVLPDGPDGQPRVRLSGDGRFSGRTPLLAAGSNAAPERLAAKLSGLGDPRLAARAVRLPGLAAVAAGHIAAYGVLPATLAVLPGAAAHLHVLLVTPEQLAAFDASEALGRHYQRRVLDHPALPFGPVLFYRAVSGVFAPDGAPLAFESLNTRKDGGALHDEAAMMEKLGRWAGLGGTAAGLSEKLRGDAGLRFRLRFKMAEQ